MVKQASPCCSGAEAEKHVSPEAQDQPGSHTSPCLRNQETGAEDYGELPLCRRLPSPSTSPRAAPEAGTAAKQHLPPRLKVWPWNPLVRDLVSSATAELRRRQTEGHRVNGALWLDVLREGCCAWSQEPIWSQLKGGNTDDQGHHLNAQLLFLLKNKEHKQLLI